MKFKIFFLLFLILSCSPHYTKLDNKKAYIATGLALIYDENDYKNKMIKHKMNNNIEQIAHQSLKIGSLIKLINPKTKEYLVLKNYKKIKYPDFYKILITKPVADKLKINNELPIIEIIEIKKNKSFIAEKAKIYKEEKKISSNAPVTSVQIANISKKKNKEKKKNTEDIYILIASFYTQNSANFLRKRINEKIPSYDNKKLKIKKKNSKEIQLISGPYKSINLLKNDYIDLKNFGFEELDIIIND
jgi:rare lipoprotein A (peptidoglycan hydrolase)